MWMTVLVCISLPLLLPLYGLAQFNTLGFSKSDFTSIITSIVILSEIEKREKVSIIITVIPAVDRIRFSPLHKNIHITSGAEWRKHTVTGQILFLKRFNLRADNEPIFVVMDGILEAVGADENSWIWEKMLHAYRFRSS